MLLLLLLLPPCWCGCCHTNLLSSIINSLGPADKVRQASAKYGQRPVPALSGSFSGPSCVGFLLRFLHLCIFSLPFSSRRYSSDSSTCCRRLPPAVLKENRRRGLRRGTTPPDRRRGRDRDGRDVPAALRTRGGKETEREAGEKLQNSCCKKCVVDRPESSSPESSSIAFHSRFSPTSCLILTLLPVCLCFLYRPLSPIKAFSVIFSVLHLLLPTNRPYSPACPRRRCRPP